MSSTNEIKKDPIIEQIKTLYELGDDGRYEIIKRMIFVTESLLILGKTAKSCVDFHMDKGIKALELGVGLTMALTRTKDKYLSKIDIELKQKILADKVNLEMIADWEKLEKQND